MGHGDTEALIHGLADTYLIHDSVCNKLTSIYAGAKVKFSFELVLKVSH